MDDTERTTIRIKKHLMKQSRDIAHNKGKSLQDVINMLIEQGIRNISDHHYRKELVRQTDILREKMSKYDTDFSDLYEANKKDQR